ncbi:MAG: DUF4924 family protein [Paludibacter sp.]|nr:DUF4924 family protein [Paludibacter sp.]
MLIASQLKKTNISEYLLYMWQVEDLIRALQFDIDQINNTIISRFQFKDDDERKAIVEWYESLIEMMRLEQVMEKGHLQLNKNVVAELNELHALLLKSGQIPAYNAKYIHVLPLINQFRRKAEPGLSDIELCFNFQYGILMLRLQKSVITPETEKTREEISKFMVLLAKNYHAWKNGELDLQ